MPTSKGRPAQKSPTIEAMRASRIVIQERTKALKEAHALIQEKTKALKEARERTPRPPGR